MTLEQKEAAQWVADQISHRPDMYDQGDWGDLVLEGPYNKTPILEFYPHCKTPQCLAGWALQWELSHHDSETPVQDIIGDDMDSALNKAADILGLSRTQAKFIFEGLSWNMTSPEAADILECAIEDGWDIALRYARDIGLAQ